MYNIAELNAMSDDFIIRLRVDLAAPDQRSMVAVLRDAKALLRALDFIKDLDPAFTRIYDMRILKVAAEQGNLPGLLEQSPDDGWLVEVGFDFRKGKTTRKLQQCVNVLPPGTFAVTETKDNTVDFREFRNALLSFLNSSQDGERTAALDDVYIPSYQLSDFMQDLQLLEQTLDLDLPLYGSFATSNYSVRPTIDYSSLAGRQLLMKFLRQYSRLVVKHGGSLTGGSPEGRVKLLPGLSTITDNEKLLYQDIKAAFDPHNILNPGVKLDVDVKDTLRHLRTTPRSGLITP